MAGKCKTSLIKFKFDLSHYLALRTLLVALHNFIGFDNLFRTYSNVFITAGRILITKFKSGIILDYSLKNTMLRLILIDRRQIIGTSVDYFTPNNKISNIFKFNTISH